MNEKSVWSWLIPAVVAVTCGLACIFITYWAGATVIVLLPVAFGFVFAIAAVTEYLAYIREGAIDRAEREHTALAITPDAYLAQEMRALAAQSPELAATIAQRVGRPDMVLFPGEQGRQPQVILAGSDVTLQFALYVLELSDLKTMAAQRNFGEGTYHWDKNGEISDRQMWMQLNWLLSQQSIVTRYVPGRPTNMAPMWLPPWTPERVRQRWLLGDVLEPFKRYLKDEEVESDGK